MRRHRRAQVQQRGGPRVLADHLQAHRQPGTRARQRHGRVPRQVEGLRQPQHHRAQRLAAIADLDRFGPQCRSHDGQRRQHQRVHLGQRGVDLALQHLARGHRPHVVLGQDVAAHLEAQAHVGRVALGAPFERLGVIRGALRQADVQVDRRRIGGMRHRHRPDRGASRGQPVQRGLVRGAHVGLQQFLEVTRQPPQSQPAPPAAAAARAA